MAYAALDASPAIADFRRQLEACTLTAVCGRSFVRTQKLRSWLQSLNSKREAQLESLLDAAHQWQASGDPGLRVTPLAVENGYLLVFCILLETGQPQYLRTFVRIEVTDALLPIRQNHLEDKLEGVEPSDAKAIAKLFFRVQYKYCAPKFDLDTDAQFSKHRILPIVREEEINKKGGTASLSKIEIPVEFVGRSLREKLGDLEPRRDEQFGEVYHFALKTFREGRKRFHETEKRAFDALRGHPGMVKCLACYSHHQLDPANPSSTGSLLDTDGGGTIHTHCLLLEYGQMDLDIFFLKRDPPLLYKEIHSFWKAMYEVACALDGIHNYELKAKKYRGWHGDVKPANILLINGELKLADLGFAEFILATGKPSVRLRGGTYTYSAPEHPPGLNSEVLQTIDTWSLGVVFSIAASWVVGGIANVHNFSEVRRGAFQAAKAPKPDIDGGDLFHNGTRLLPEISQWHKLLRGLLRQIDNITAEVLDIVDNEMLLEAPVDRIGVRQLCKKLEAILNKPREDVQTLPPGIITKALYETNKHADSGLLNRPSVTAEDLEDSSGTSEIRQSRKKQALTYPLPKTAYREESLRLVLGELPEASTGDTYGNRQIGNGTTGLDLAVGARADTPPASMTPNLTLRVSGQDLATGPANNTRRPSTPSEGVPPIKRKDAPYPPKTLTQVQAEMSKTGNRMVRAAFQYMGKKAPKNKDLEQYFKDRDIKFVIDNGETMLPYWSDACNAVKALTQMAAALDDDGLDLCFTCSGARAEKQNNEKKFLKLMSQEKPIAGKHTDMKKVLGDLFDEHIRYLKLRPSENKRALTLLVLTDGIWNGMYSPASVQDKIVNFIRTVTQHRGNLRDRPVSMEFIQFGDNADATYRLEYLDDRLAEEEGIDDVIDMEPVGGIAYKMLVGSFVEEWDRVEREPLSPQPPSIPPRGAFSPNVCR